MLGAGGLLAFPSGDLARPMRALSVLTPRTFGVLVCVARRIVTIDGADHVAIAHRIDDGLRWISRESQDDVRGVLMLLENALPGLLFDGRIQPFSRLSAPAQDAVLARWRTSALTLRRSGYMALRQLCVAAFYIEQDSWDVLGYPQPIPFPIAYDDSTFGSSA